MEEYLKWTPGRGQGSIYKGCILIDDMALNITEWENAGGTGIQNLDAASTMEKLKAMGIL